MLLQVLPRGRELTHESRPGQAPARAEHEAHLVHARQLLVRSFCAAQFGSRGRESVETLPEDDGKGSRRVLLSVCRSGSSNGGSPGWGSLFGGGLR